MIHRTHIFAALPICFAISLLGTGIISSAYAEQEKTKQDQKSIPAKMQGKVTDVTNVPNYTYVEVDTGKKKVWVAGPTTPLKIGDKVVFSTRMPMKNFHSKAMKRDFSIVYL